MSIHLINGSIRGDSRSALYPNSVDVKRIMSTGSYTNTKAHGTRQANAVGSPELSPFVLSKYIDSATPMLWQAMVRGQVLDEATLCVTGPVAGAPLILQYDFKDVRVINADIDFDGDLGENTETISLSFGKITMSIPGLAGAPQILFEYDLRTR